RRRDVFAPSSHGFDGKEPRRARPSTGVAVLRPGEPEAMDFWTMRWAHAPIPLTCSWSGVSIVFVNAAPYVLHAEVAELADALRSGRSGLHAREGSTPSFGTNGKRPAIRGQPGLRVLLFRLPVSGAPLRTQVRPFALRQPSMPPAASPVRRRSMCSSPTAPASLRRARRAAPPMGGSRGGA